MRCMVLQAAHEEGDRDGQECERAAEDDVLTHFDTVIDIWQILYGLCVGAI